MRRTDGRRVIVRPTTATIRVAYLGKSEPKSVHRNPEMKVRKLADMRFLVFSAGLVLTIACGIEIGQTNTPASAVPLARSIRSFPFDPETPLESRIQALRSAEHTPE